MDIPLYLQRIGIDSIPTVSSKALSQLTKAHLYNIPFENIDVMTGNYIDLSVARFYDKIVIRKRGGFCYELNGLFHELLRQLGYEIMLIAATVLQKDGSWAYPNSHAANIVYVEGEAYLVDVGFGDSCIEPVPLNGKILRDQSGTYRIKEQEGLYYLERYEKRWRTQYCFSLVPRQLVEMKEAAHYNQTSPSSIFTQGYILTIRTMNGRITITDTSITITNHRSRTKKTIHHTSEWVDFIQYYMGIPNQEMAVIQPHLMDGS
ncbi:arylamine N-acetyltransferase [Pontibacillus salicampi]|uniref:Arylamine N-acetyltransferase n=1 Tax=Pontibacillus salicampi TaxID=1449801 RepID=A0ABV6LIR8_9BACI